MVALGVLIPCPFVLADTQFQIDRVAVLFLLVYCSPRYIPLSLLVHFFKLDCVLLTFGRGTLVSIAGHIFFSADALYDLLSCVNLLLLFVCHASLADRSVP